MINKILLQGPNLYHIRLPASSLWLSSTASPIAFITTSTSSKFWHQRLSHPSPSTQHLLSTILPSHKLAFTTPQCLSCARAKCHRLPFSLSSPKRTQCLKIIHSDL
ncbi:hypothetical protein KFK09_002771 [Dendrobium nobile]|uniref:GAG-pre-integrase domain-containing protein n=1 Tax=Dendrobium nobile TaxID=94219 RepID=A0A8T3C7T6_DENNO|nr:hypothetical protein KFK09_002771 [Dendrobium nobile]